MQYFDETFANNNDHLVIDPGTLRVSLEFFTASRSSIKPFEEAVLEWKVISLGAAPPIVRLNNRPVPAEGSVIVRPRSSSIYRLSAEHNSNFVQLGSTEVNVDTTDCLEGGIIEAEGLLSGSFAQRIEKDSDTWLKNEYKDGKPTGNKIKPKVNVNETGIDLLLQFGSKTDRLPDPTITFDSRFRWAINGRTIEPFFMKQDVKIEFPFHTYFIPGTFIILPIVIGMAKDTVRNSIHDGLMDFAEVFLRTPAGRRLLNIRTTSGFRGQIITTHCPDLSLKPEAPPDGGFIPL